MSEKDPADDVQSWVLPFFRAIRTGLLGREVIGIVKLNFRLDSRMSKEEEKKKSEPEEVSWDSHAQFLLGEFHFRWL